MDETPDERDYKGYDECRCIESVQSNAAALEYVQAREIGRSPHAPQSMREHKNSAAAYKNEILSSSALIIASGRLALLAVPCCALPAFAC
jgi:hypothetical protein